MLGDSISYGKGLTRAERFTERLAAAHPGLEIYNLAYPACGTVCFYTWLGELMFLKPDLVIVQPSGNDVDHTMARVASSQRPLMILRWAMRSRAIQAMAYGFFGDAKTEQLDVAVEKTGRFYRKYLDELFALVRKGGARAMVLSFPGSNDVWYGGHVEATCTGSAADVCLGVVRLDVAHPDVWIPDFASRPAAPIPDWLIETADSMDLEVDTLAQLFPFSGFYFDIVHPNAATHEIAAAQLKAFLTEKWPAAAAP